MKRTIYLLILATIPRLLKASEIQHILDGLFDFYFLFTLVGIFVNILLLYLYHKTKNAGVALLLMIIGGLSVFIGFQLFVSSFDGLLIFGVIFLALGFYSALLPLKKYMTVEDDENTGTRDE
jgi:hypothetical protein